MPLPPAQSVLGDLALGVGGLGFGLPGNTVLVGIDASNTSPLSISLDPLSVGARIGGLHTIGGANTDPLIFDIDSLSAGARVSPLHSIGGGNRSPLSVTLETRSAGARIGAVPAGTDDFGGAGFFFFLNDGEPFLHALLNEEL